MGSAILLITGVHGCNSGCTRLTSLGARFGSEFGANGIWCLMIVRSKGISPELVICAPITDILFE